MLTEHTLWLREEGWKVVAKSAGFDSPHIVFYFGEIVSTPAEEIYALLRERYPKAHIVGCNSATHISNDELYEEGLVALAVRFEKTDISVVSTELSGMEDSHEAGQRIGRQLSREDLRGIFVISDGVLLNGSEFSRGINAIIDRKVPVFGGMAADGGRFQSTPVACDGPAREHVVAAVGFYGNKIKIGCGSQGGWVTFGPRRKITKSKGNILYELDGRPALELYKKYLGEEVENLPTSALSFPLMISNEDSKSQGIVRSVIGVDEEKNTLTFAGDVTEGQMAQLMRTSHEGLINGAGSSARNAMENRDKGELAILVSCIGRKQILKQRTEDEIEVVHDILGQNMPKVGFYSHGEFSPHENSGFCELHNQTMTITILSEDA